MNIDLLKQKAATQAWAELQAAIGIMYCGDGDAKTKNEEELNVQKHLEACNEWLIALKG